MSEPCQELKQISIPGPNEPGTIYAEHSHYVPAHCVLDAGHRGPCAGIVDEPELVVGVSSDEPPPSEESLIAKVKKSFAPKAK